MTIDPELNLFSSDPTLLQPGSESEYERAADALALVADPVRLKVLHALLVGEDTAQRAACWAVLPQPAVERAIEALEERGIVARIDGAVPRFTPRDGHLVVQVHLALAHGREATARHPRLLRRRREAAVAG